MIFRDANMISPFYVLIGTHSVVRMIPVDRECLFNSFCQRKLSFLDNIPANIHEVPLFLTVLEGMLTDIILVCNVY